MQRRCYRGRPGTKKDSKNGVWKTLSKAGVVIHNLKKYNNFYNIPDMTNKFDCEANYGTLCLIL
jgi:hypothetical protein